MLNPVKLRLFTKAVIIKVKAGAQLADVIDSYTALSDSEKKQLREAVENELSPEEPEAMGNAVESD
jgi:hypothetical protein